MNTKQCIEFAKIQQIISETRTAPFTRLLLEYRAETRDIIDFFRYVDEFKPAFGQWTNEPLSYTYDDAITFDEENIITQFEHFKQHQQLHYLQNMNKYKYIL